jgi:putative FmdB family regulatory protein
VPTYEYKCSSCGHRYETREGFDAPPTQACPSCGAVAKRVLFPPPIVFKGSGFYITDSRKGTSATVADTASLPAGTPPPESKTKTEAAPAPSKPATSATTSSSDD